MARPEPAAVHGHGRYVVGQPGGGLGGVRLLQAAGGLPGRRGVAVTWDLGGITTAFCAEAGSGTPIIGYLGEYDALAGLSQKRQPTQEPVVEGGPGHGCGHNLLGTGGLAAAVAVARWLNATGTAGTVRYYGCPAEEQISGKAFMARTGSFDDLDAAFNYHPAKVNAPSKGTCVGVIPADSPVVSQPLPASR